MLSRLNRFLRGMDDAACRRVLSTRETEARDCARLLVSLEEVYEARHDEQLFFGASPLVIEDPKNAPERLRKKLHILKGELDGLVLLVRALSILDDQDALKVVQDQLNRLEARLDQFADMQAVQPSGGDSRNEEVAQGGVIPV